MAWWERGHVGHVVEQPENNLEHKNIFEQQFIRFHDFSASVSSSTLEHFFNTSNKTPEHVSVRVDN